MKKTLLPLLLCGFALAVEAQNRVVTGRLTTSEDGSALPGTNVSLKGTAVGTVTDFNGAFTLSVPASGGVLIFSFVGFQNQEVAINERAIFDIQLSPDLTQLSEVVVTGAGVATDKKKLGIAVESISSGDLPAAPSASIDQALVGKIAGAQISSISGNPGDPVQILLRGINTVQHGTLPMILMDGVQVSGTDLNSLDLSNIDRVEVVQGSAAAAIFGAQGANGVIQVFTKKGQKGHLSINYSSSYSANQYINVKNNLSETNLHPYLTDANNDLIDNMGNNLMYDQFGNLPGISYRYGGATRYAIINTQNISNTPYNANIKFYNHFKQVFQTGHTINNALSISGGTDKTDFNISVSDNKTESPVLQNGYVERTNLSVNVGTELLKGLTIRSTTQLIYTKNTLMPGLGAAGGIGYGYGNSQGNVTNILGALNTPAFFDLNAKLADGTYPDHLQGGSFAGINGVNPNYIKEYTRGLDNKVDIVQNFNANYKVNKFLELDAKYGINYRNESATWTYLNQSQNINASHWSLANVYYAAYQNFNDLNGEIDIFNYASTFQNFLASSFIRTDFKDDFHSKLPIETSTQVSFDYRKRNYTELDVYGLDLSTNPPYNLQNTASQAVVHGTGYSPGGAYTEPFITYGYLVNQKINYGDYGGLTAGYRSDWSSAFGGGSKPFTFPHADGFILPSTFWKDSKTGRTLTYFKLRAAYGQAGIQPNAFDRYPVISPGAIGNQSVYSIAAIGRNSDLKVEVSKEFETGTDFSIASNSKSDWFSAINGSFTYWTRKSENVIYSVSTPPSIGASQSLTNAINMQGNGYQFSLNTPVFKTGNFSWNFTNNWSHQISRIISIQGGNDIILSSSDPTGSTSLVLHAGSIIGQVNGHQAYTSIAAANADLAKSQLPAENFVMVNGRVVDANTYQIQFNPNKVPIGNPNPKFNTSFINSFSYKNFLTLALQFDWIYGSHLYNQTKEWMYRDGIHSDFAKQVNINGEKGAYTAYWSSPYYNLLGSEHGGDNGGTRDFFWENASFLRLRNISVGFDIAKFANIKNCRKLQVIFTGRNLLTFTKYSGADPEISSGTANSAFNRNVDNSTIPNIKSYQIGVNVGF
jgi:TonB-linked SusC/RagA family outer membrane protein